MPLFIAEVKTCSPFGFKSEHSFDYLLDAAIEHGDAIAIHTDPRWGGDFSLIRKAKEKTDKPILAKGIHHTDNDVRRAIFSGAVLALVVGRHDVPPSFHMRTVFEPTSLSQIEGMPPHMAIMWNSRDLSTGEAKKETWEEMRKICGYRFTIQASNIKTKDDLKPDANGFIVGEHLLNFIKSYRK